MNGDLRTPPQRSYANEVAWSKREKTVARTAFEAALDRELRDVMRQAKDRADSLQQSSDLWELERYLSESRREIDRKYDYRYSQLIHVLGTLLSQGRLQEAELQGLAEDKLQRIRSLAEWLAKSTA
jgi:hypothetical protein